MADTRTPDAPSRLPWPSLIVLGAAAFVMVTAEMLPTAVLPWMSAGLDVPEPQIGLLVSIWAGVVVVASIPLARLTRRFDRRAVIFWSLLALAVSTGLTALVQTYPDAVAARMLGAVAVGLLWATTNAHTADLVADRDLGRAVAVVLGGATLGTVLGTPVASVVAQAIGWRAAFGALAVVAVVAAVLVRTVVRAAPFPGASKRADGSAHAATSAGPLRGLRAIRPFMVVIALVSVLLVGHYGAFTYITRLVEAPAASVPGGIGIVLFAFGVASALGVFVAGRFANTSRALVGATVVTALAVAALGVVHVHPVVGIAVVLVWGVASGAVPPLAQTLVLRLAGPERRDLAGALIPVVFNLGIAIGAAAASGVVGGAGLVALPPLAAAVVAASALGLVIAGRVRSRSRSRGTDANVRARATA